MTFEIGQTVEIKENRGGKRWTFKDAYGGVRTGLVTRVDKYCLDVRTDDTGEHIRDVVEHFRPHK